MTKVFFGGSRKIGRLNAEIRKRVNNVIVNRFFILIGDANGTDKALQKYLVERGYSNVIVYCSGSLCRNNLGHWRTEFVASDRTKKDFQHYVKKDEQMSEEADYGFFLWDGKSKGTLKNILTMVARKKNALVYLSPAREFVTVKSIQDINGLLDRCDPRAAEVFRRLFYSNDIDVIQQSQLDLV